MGGKARREHRPGSKGHSFYSQAGLCPSPVPEPVMSRSLSLLICKMGLRKARTTWGIANFQQDNSARIGLRCSSDSSLSGALDHRLLRNFFRPTRLLLGPGLRASPNGRRPQRRARLASQRRLRLKLTETRKEKPAAKSTHVGRRSHGLGAPACVLPPSLHGLPASPALSFLGTVGSKPEQAGFRGPPGTHLRLSPGRNIEANGFGSQRFCAFCCSM